MQPLLDKIEARDRTGGHPHIDPAILVALWLYATLDGVRGARELARFRDTHAAYRWIRGGGGVNHPTLSNFGWGTAIGWMWHVQALRPA